MSRPYSRRSRVGSWVWLFDLDNTLHDATQAIFPHINRSMTHYIAQQLALDATQAGALREHYWQRYGATLLGLLRHHAIDAGHFLRQTHQFDDLGSMIRAERGLLQLFSKLPGRKVLLTNAPHHYARQVLAHLGLHRHFQRSYAVEQMRIHGQYRPKPSRAMLRAIARRERTLPQRCILVEDTLENLRSAKACGMATVWVCGVARSMTGGDCIKTMQKNRPQYVDLKIQSVRALLRRYGSVEGMM
jgi:putative hydrolase of the HAD superfamily